MPSSARTAHSPARLSTPMERKASAWAKLDLADIEPRAQPDIAHRDVALATPRSKLLHPGFAQPLDLAEAEPDGMAGPDDIPHFGVALLDAFWVEARTLERTVPDGMVDVDLANFDAVILCIAHQLCRPVEAHRLRVQDRRAEHVWIVGLEPA